MAFGLGIFKRKKAPTNMISVEYHYMDKGIGVRVRHESGETLSLPVQLSISELKSQPDLEKLELVEQLWYEEYLSDGEEGGYFLPYEILYLLEPNERFQLGFPEVVQHVQAELRNISFVGSRSFSLELKFLHPRIKERKGAMLFGFDGSSVLLEQNLYELCQLLEKQPNPRGPEHEMLHFLGDVKKRATELGLAISDHLQEQNFAFVDTCELDVMGDSSRLNLSLSYHTESEVSPETLREMGRNAEIYRNDRENKRKIVVAPSVQRQAVLVKEMHPFEGQDVPKFVSNPTAYLPEVEGFDLSRFGERVRDIGVRVYKAKPFLHAKEERGWFEVDAGIQLSDEDGDRQRGLNDEEIGKLKEAKEKGDEFVHWDGGWVRVPDNIIPFKEATDRIRRERETIGKISKERVSYILEIFENVSELEYNKPILDVLGELENHGVLERQTSPTFQGTLKRFQEDAFVWMKRLHWRRIGGLLADDMGLGKTVQVISMLAYMHDNGFLGPTLLVVPKTLADNWCEEISKFAPALRSRILLHMGQDRIKDEQVLKNSLLVVTTYQTLVRDQLYLGKNDWQAVILDEAQNIKNESTASSHAVKAMKSVFRLAMTGTPVENSLADLWSIMNFVQPGILGSLKEFKTRYADEIDRGVPGADQRLIETISPIYKRRVKNEELKGQLPEKSERRYQVPLGSEQKELYEQVVREVSSGGSALEAIRKLRWLASHPGLVDPAYKNLPANRIPKLAKTLDILRELQQKGEKALIFTEIREMQVILKRVILEEFGIQPMVINGMSERRQETVKLFNKQAGFDVIILSTKAAGTGLTITSANHVIHYTRWWNPATENQATDRAYRIGQEKPVTVHYPIVTDQEGFLKNGTVEEILDRILHDRQSLAQNVIRPSSQLECEGQVMEKVFYGI